MNLNTDFIARIVRTTAAVLAIAFAYGIYYFGFYPALSFLSGGVWGMVNLMFMAGLIRATLRPDGIDLAKAFGMAAFKFPVLYLAGYSLLMVSQFDQKFLLFGSLTILGVMVLKAMGRALLGLDASPQVSQNSGKVVS